MSVWICILGACTWEEFYRFRAIYLWKLYFKLIIFTLSLVQESSLESALLRNFPPAMALLASTHPAPQQCPNGNSQDLAFLRKTGCILGIIISTLGRFKYFFFWVFDHWHYNGLSLFALCGTGDLNSCNNKSISDHIPLRTCMLCHYLRCVQKICPFASPCKI